MDKDFNKVFLVSLPIFDVVLRLRNQYRDGITIHIVMSPLEFMRCLATLVPPPKLNLILYNGVLAPHAKLRPQIIPDRPVSVSDDPRGALHQSVLARIS